LHHTRYVYFRFHVYTGTKLIYDVHRFLADRSTVALLVQCCVRRSLFVTLCIVVKWCVVEQKLLLTA